MSTDLTTGPFTLRPPGCRERRGARPRTGVTSASPGST